MVAKATIRASNRPPPLTLTEQLEDFGFGLCFSAAGGGGALATGGNGGSTTSVGLSWGGSATGSDKNSMPGITGFITYGESF